MKIKNHLQLILAFTLATFIFSSCKEDDPVPTPTNTITDIVVKTASYSVLKEAVVKAGLDGTLKGAGPFTVFAPDNTAFSAAGITSSTVSSTAASALSNLLLYHTISAKILAADVPAGPNAKVTTTSGDSVFVTRDARGVFINGISVAEANINADNGVIHRLSKALNNPTGNIVATAASVTGGTTGLDSLVKAITRANNEAGGDPTLISTLNNNIITVFAPTNAAFTRLLTALSLTNINQIPIGVLTAVLKYHVKLGRAFSSDIVNTNSFAMFAGGNTTLSTTGPTIKGNNSVLNLNVGGSTANICNILSTNNVMARNGVVHLIENVLLP